MSQNTDNSNKRHWIIAVVLQVLIRIRYVYESWFGIKPLFFGISPYVSKWRPKDMPK
jgi:hypothetical protein